MMPTSIINSPEREQLWVEQICKTFNPEFAIAIDDPPCVFRVPKSLKDTKPEAYTPQKLGLGPYHHLDPECYALQRKKLSAIRKFVGQDRFHNFPKVMIKRFMELEPIIRACYDEYLEINGQTLALILSIDGTYLFYLLRSYVNRNVSESATYIELTDLTMLENQIPAVVLNELWSTHAHSSGDEKKGLFYYLFRYICVLRSPLKLTDEIEFTNDTKSPHYLGYMYHLIVNNRGINTMSPVVTQNRIECARGLSTIVSIAASLLKVCSNDENNQMVEEIEIPSVTQLVEIGEVEFILSPGGIRDVNFNDEEHTFHLPAIILREDSEVILRNLMAYEAAIATPGSNLELTEYVDLMCGIVDTAKDVEILRGKGIITGDLGDEEIARLFNGISKSSWNKKRKSELEEVIDQVNQEYKNSSIQVSLKLLIALLIILLLLVIAWKVYSHIYLKMSTFMAQNYGKGIYSWGYI